MQTPSMFLRFIANGAIATLIHYAVLAGLFESRAVASAGIANAFGAICGIAASYIGNRAFVFRATNSNGSSLPRFLAVYAGVAAIHAGGLCLWTDLYGQPYWTGFVGLTMLSLMVTFTANRLFVFKDASQIMTAKGPHPARKPFVGETAKLLAVAMLICVGFLVCVLTNIIHFRFFSVSVVLYDAVIDVTIGVVICAAFYGLFIARRLKLGLTEIVLALLAVWLAGLTYAVYFPAIIDRSLSMYILEKIDQRGGGIRQDAFEEVFIKEYVPEHRLVDIRLTEQLNSGTIAINNGCVVLTKRGRGVVAFTSFYREHMLPKRRNIMGRYVDDLTNPFRNSRRDVNYRCTPVPP
jgi:putative flippase GtrA